ncbi:MAG: cytochrome c-type biosis protein CcmE [Thermoleophilaceae bacterium]|jgi:cytochrome c-type biogenesis protein CcmE|nr:cytochrome c-type biosis protein CcmE [Thermoleophilaceae bacterium]
MDPSRKRKIRLVVALGTAVLLAGALMYTSFTAGTPARTPSQLLASAGTGDYKLTGKVVAGSVKDVGDDIEFKVSDRDGKASLPVKYAGVVPDPFREGREVIVDGRLRDGTFVADRDSLVTKCPSKFKNAPDSTGKKS